MDITYSLLEKKKCPLCGDFHKTFANIRLGHDHIATVTTCCNCGFTMTFSHSAKEYARYLEEMAYTYHPEICTEYNTCKYNESCPKIKKGMKT